MVARTLANFIADWQVATEGRSDGWRTRRYIISMPIGEGTQDHELIAIIIRGSPGRSSGKMY